MKTIIIEPLKKLPDVPWEITEIITNGAHPLPKTNLPVTVISPCPMVKGHPGVVQNHWRLVMGGAEALYLEGINDHLYRCARMYGLKVHAPRYSAARDAEIMATIGRPAQPEWTEHLHDGDEDDDLFGSEEGPTAEPDESDLFGPESDADLFA